MSVFRNLIVAVGVMVGVLAVNSCGSWLKCMGGNSCSKSAENAATSQLFLNAVNSSLTSFKSVMTELGLSDDQQTTVVSGVQSKAQELTSQLSLTEDTTYSGTMLEKLTSMFSDLMEYAVGKISEVAPDIDTAAISNAIALFANELIASADEQGIVSSLPASELENIKSEGGEGTAEELFRPGITQTAVGSLVAQRPNAKPGEMMAAMDYFQRKPGEKAMPPGQIVKYKPSDAESASAQGRIQGDLCKGSPASMGRGKTTDASRADRILLTMPGCDGVALDRDAIFCLTAPVSVFKVCSNVIYGASASATKTSVKFWIDAVENQFADFPSGQVYDCSDLNARKDLAQLIGNAISTKKSTCKAFAAPQSTSAPGGTQSAPANPQGTPQ